MPTDLENCKKKKVTGIDNLVRKYSVYGRTHILYMNSDQKTEDRCTITLGWYFAFKMLSSKLFSLWERLNRTDYPIDITII